MPAIGGDRPSDDARLHIDWTRCDGRGLCAELLPELLDRDEWGYPLPTQTRDRSNVSVPSDLVDAARSATRVCPLLALRLLEPTRL
ncbi:ferredoxin [Planctomonas sp. JC2975]|uniref:ferredoxin n=1 Tax=Planctomonas sp. JC2975 TaxID=2729626 RepID=UPI001472A108|nr:ferredoxin [Planctomonas sp. JC2975]NNC11307.1 ferredoxin [Planctomonas sp. JC2975]